MTGAMSKRIRALLSKCFETGKPMAYPMALETRALKMTEEVSTSKDGLRILIGLNQIAWPFFRHQSTERRMPSRKAIVGA